MVVCMRRFVMLSLDDCLYVVQSFLPALSRASVHRCFRRHSISRPPQTTPHGPTQLGWFNVHVIPLGQGEQAAWLYVAVERQSKYIFAEVREDTARSASDFLQALQQKSPVTLFGVCVERSAPSWFKRTMMRICADAAVRYRLIAARWPVDGRSRIELLDGQNIALQPGPKAAMRRRVAAFLSRYNDGCRLKTLGGLTPAAHIKRRSEETAVDRALKAAAGESSKPVANKREQILQCARTLLSTVGPDGMSLSKVARMAGVNRGSIYRNFNSRSQLIAAASEWSSEQLTQAIFGEPFDEGENPDARGNVLRVMRRLANFAIRNPAMGQAWLLQILSMSDPSRDRFWREYHGRSVRFHQRPPAAKDIDAEVLAVIMLAGTFLWPIWSRAKSGGGANLQQQADRFLQEFFRLAIHGVLRPEYVPDADAELQAMRLHR
jgi:AcrR family transcriptional regulator